MVISEVAQSCPTLCNPMDCSLPGSSIHGIFQVRVLEWVAMSFSRGSSKEYFNFIIQHEAVFSSSPTPVAEENAFSPLSILLYFVIDYLTMDWWNYFWALYLVPLMVLWCQYNIILIIISLYYNSKSGNMSPPSLFFFLKIVLSFRVFFSPMYNLK